MTDVGTAGIGVGAGTGAGAGAGAPAAGLQGAPEGEPLLVPAAPALPGAAEEAAGRGGAWTALLPLLASVGALPLLLMPGMPAAARLGGAAMVASSLAVGAAQLVRLRSGPAARLREARRDYLALLSEVRVRAQRAAARQREELLAGHPEPARLWELVAGGRTVRRRCGDEGFGVVRVGSGPQPLAVGPVPVASETPPARRDPLCERARCRLVAVHRTVPDLPVVLAVTGAPRVVVCAGARGAEAARGVLRALVAQLTVHHAPGDVAVEVRAEGAAARHWEWVKWLPHARRSDDGGGGAPADGRRLVLVAEGAAVPDRPGVTVLEAAAGGADVPGALMVDISGGGLELRRDGEAFPGGGTADRLGPAAAESLARALARAAGAGPGSGSGADDAPSGFAALHGLPSAGADPAVTQSRGTGADRLRVPIGVVEGTGRPLLLDLKEAAAGGAGPHGLCVGATGSGKSELLRTLVLGLALTHRSDAVNFVLVDFKGGATFDGLAALPHTAALVTNLEAELHLVDRLADAIGGELRRRQEVLREAGARLGARLPGAAEYEAARADGAPLEPLPSLLVVVDEFGELLAARGEFAEVFTQIGRIGRSLGVHLLLASQRLEEGRLSGLEAALSYRIGLRTFSAEESRAALGVPDAHTLPRVPGCGYLRIGSEPLTRFRAAYVSAPPPAPPSDEPRAVRLFAAATRIEEPPAPSPRPRPAAPDAPCPQPADRPWRTPAAAQRTTRRADRVPAPRKAGDAAPHQPRPADRGRPDTTSDAHPQVRVTATRAERPRPPQATTTPATDAGRQQGSESVPGPRQPIPQTGGSQAPADWPPATPPTTWPTPGAPPTTPT
ncbi:FtsK/SpoIIIE domain-containing protein, partial [Mangrovactinospora gilvigrisea]|uniref:FtsK/SpoIIIE domain-containing protein n=1 Tax=Mangrovactinospora gilvigrisea TaxID=1428644 RepID=UPI002244FB27